MCQGIPQLSKRHVLPDSGTNRNNDQRTLFFEMNHDPIGYNLGFDPQTNLQKVTALLCLTLMSTTRAGIAPATRDISHVLRKGGD
jgi:hypothetical protein